MFKPEHFVECLYNRRMLKWLTSSLIFILIVGSLDGSATTLPDDIYKIAKTVALESRDYGAQHEIGFHTGLIPSDAFNRGVLLGLQYQLRINSLFSWEALRASYIVTQETSLKKDLENSDIDLITTGFNGPLDPSQSIISSNLVYSPIYTKGVFHNEILIHGEFGLNSGIGAIHFKENGWRGIINLGLFLKLYTSFKNSVQIDFRNHIYNEDKQGLVNAYTLMFSYQWGFGDLN